MLSVSVIQVNWKRTQSDWLKMEMIETAVLFFIFSFESQRRDKKVFPFFILILRSFFFVWSPVSLDSSFETRRYMFYLLFQDQGIIDPSLNVWSEIRQCLFLRRQTEEGLSQHQRLQTESSSRSIQEDTWRRTDGKWHPLCYHSACRSVSPLIFFLSAVKMDSDSFSLSFTLRGRRRWWWWRKEAR